MAEANTTTTARYASDPDPSQASGVAPRLSLSPINVNLTTAERPGEVLRLAQEAFTKTDNWVVFYREMMGVDGVVRKLFTTPEEMREFEQSAAFIELQEMVAAVRSQDTSKGDSAEPERMITIRLPKSLHDVLKCEADETNLSINKLCISKLIQRIDSRCVPIQQGRRRGRRPGPQGPRSKTTSENNTSEATLEKANVQPGSERFSAPATSPPENNGTMDSGPTYR